MNIEKHLTLQPYEIATIRDAINQDVKVAVNCIVWGRVAMGLWTTLAADLEQVIDNAVCTNNNFSPVCIETK